MQGMLVAPLAVLLELDTLGVVLLILFGRIIAALALRAGQGDQRTHENSFYLYMNASQSLYT